MPLLLRRSVVELVLAREFGGVAAVAFLRGEGFGVGHGLRAGDEASVDAGEEGVGAEAVGAVDGVIGFACCKDAGDVGLLVEVDPEAAHGVVHAGEDLHGDFAGVVADELLVDFEDAFELVLAFWREVREVEVDHGLAVDAHVVFVDDFEDVAGGDVAGDEVAVLGVPLFEEVPAVGFGDGLGCALVVRSLGTQTRPPSPRADSDMRRSLSSPGMAVGWTWMNSPLA